MEKKKKKVRLEFRRKETKKEKKNGEKHLSLDKGEKKRRKKSENVGFNGPIFFKKKHVLLFFIYNFYFANLIYK